jgi:hypothetical protein
VRLSVDINQPVLGSKGLGEGEDDGGEHKDSHEQQGEVLQGSLSSLRWWKVLNEVHGRESNHAGFFAPEQVREHREREREQPRE